MLYHGLLLFVNLVLFFCLHYIVVILFEKDIFGPLFLKILWKNPKTIDLLTFYLQNLEIKHRNEASTLSTVKPLYNMTTYNMNINRRSVFTTWLFTLHQKSCCTAVWLYIHFKTTRTMKYDVRYIIRFQIYHSKTKIKALITLSSCQEVRNLTLLE